MPEKPRLRAESLARREAETDRDRKSAAIAARVAGLPEFGSARIVAVFVGVRSEVATLDLIAHALREGKRVAVPVVGGADLRLVAIEGAGELGPAPFGLLEPVAGVRSDPARQVRPDEVDLFLVPGLAFDRRGGRLGHGKGYYDRLLRGARPASRRVALAFECQVVDAVPMTARDVPMHMLVTEARVLPV